MIVLILILIVLHLLGFYMEAKWDAEAFKNGQSNHSYKVWGIIFKMDVLFCAILIGASYGIDNIWTLCLVWLILSAQYVFLRIAFFDTIINSIRKKPDGYKSTSKFIEWASAFFGIIVMPFLIYLIS